ncbi:Palmitoyl-monogalactosyldiacylglycerol delta-7 desaturase, chloroplastic [Symbiodinium microadriaticum]|uniref:Palmitoyl-monogalactosyldiacylglycerol delta-7 desaturase, chloroplastic n=1 Tax=Symbiodinium microadriaticum TaxID=2951 RepID=A0A1Q9D6G6_SYMMI|nr:Palmitoyl-monogalactosyldiacylglycerol delta-7 desaturase, chloroplastic [Symbiodinium microadriaticum]
MSESAQGSSACCRAKVCSMAHAQPKMVELVLQQDSSSSQTTIAAVSIGDSQTVGNLRDVRTSFHFAKATGHYGKVEVFHRLAGCRLDPVLDHVPEAKVLLREASSSQETAREGDPGPGQPAEASDLGAKCSASEYIKMPRRTIFRSMALVGELAPRREGQERSVAEMLEYFIAYCGALNMQGNPIWWAMNHTWHHRFSDTPWDPHTPREGLWTAHAGWFFEKERVLEKMPKAIVASHNHVEPGEEDEAYLPWFYKESPQFYDWLRQTYYIHQVSQVALLYLLGGWSFVVWGFVIRLLLGIHGVSAVNSFAHVWGEQPFNTGDDSKNNVWVAMVSSGEGWHNNHHAFPRSARHGLFPGQFDLTYNLILLLEKLGVVWDVQLPSDAQIAAKLRSASEAKEAKDAKGSSPDMSNAIEKLWPLHEHDLEARLACAVEELLKKRPPPEAACEFLAAALCAG